MPLSKRKYFSNLAITLFNLLACFFSSLSVANFQTCEELAIWIGKTNNKIKRIPNGEPIVWPKTLINESNLKREFKNNITPFWNSAQEQYFPASNGINLPYRVFKHPNERAAVVILPGHKMDKSRYQEFIYSLFNEGYSVYIYDHRGQGQAERLTKNPQVAHVEDFQLYIDDMGIFMNTIVKKSSHPRTFAIGESMGGLISTHFTLNNPKEFDALATMAPAYGIKIPIVPKAFAKWVLGNQIKNGSGKEYPRFIKDRNIDGYENKKNEFYGPARFLIEVESMRNDSSLLMGGPSSKLALELINWSDSASQRAIDMKTPHLLFQAGNDKIISGKAIQTFGKNSLFSSQMCLNGSNHCMFHEGDFTHHVLMSDLYRFLIHPERLDDSFRVDEMPRLIGDAENYFARGELALAKYAIDEARATAETRKVKTFQWDSPDTKIRYKNILANVDKSFNSASDGEKGLYTFFKHRRKQELEKFYPQFEGSFSKWLSYDF